MIRAEECVLVVVDVQTRLLNIIWRRDRLMDRLVRLLKGATVLDIPILVTEQIPAKLGGTDPTLRTLVGEGTPIAKNTFSCMAESVFQSHLKGLGRKYIWLAGVETHVCVYQTARDLLSAGYRVDIVADAVSSRTEDDYRLGLERMRAAGAGWTSVEMALFEMLTQAEGDRFKAILHIVK